MKAVVFLILCFFLKCRGEIISDEAYALMPKIFHLDDFDDCWLYEANAFYCWVTLQVFPQDATNASYIWKIIEIVSLKRSNYRHDLLRHGVCLPMSCPSKKTNTTQSNESQVKIISKCYHEKYKPKGLSVQIVELSCQDKNKHNYEVTTYDIIFMCALIIYFVFVILASIYEGKARYRSKTEYNKYMANNYRKCIALFSIPKNFYRLIDCSYQTQDQQSLSPIQGIRFYNMLCVISAHTVMITFGGPVLNPQFTERINNEFLNAFMTNGGYVVQTFLLISAWLLTYKFLESYGNNKKPTWKTILMIAVYRYMRLSPTLAVMLVFHSTWMIHLSRGPFWEKIVGEEYRNCRRNWWTNLLFINNVINKENMCMQQTWYLATDMQLFIIFLIVLYILSKTPKLWKYAFAFLTFLGILIPAVVSYVRKYDILVRQYPESFYSFFLLEPQWHEMYSSPYANLSGYSTGMVFGYLFYKSKHRKVFTSKLHVTFWWILSFGLPISTILVAGKMYQENYIYTNFEAALYWGFGKFIFGLGIAIAIYGMTQNIGWFCLWVCRWRAAQILGRLTYSAYIIHVGMIKVRLASNHQASYLSKGLIAHNYLGDVVMSYIGAFLVSLFIEMPFSALQKLIFQTFNK